MALEKPAAVVLDILLDGEDSWDLLAALKEDTATRHIPVVVVSTVEDPGKAYHLGADRYLIKPVARERFLEILRQLTTIPASPRVLIIDDDEKDRYILKHRLRAAGLQIDEAVDGAEGLARAIADRPELIFLDLSMPGMNGFEVLDSLKADPRTSSIDVIVQTSLVLDKVAYQRLAGRVAAIVTKDGRDISPGIDAIVARLQRGGRTARQRSS